MQIKSSHIPKIETKKSAKNAIFSVTYSFPFGMPMPNRQYSLSSGSKYRFGFNGQEKDDEVYGAGNLNTAEFWEYDTRIGRRWNLDPKPQISISDYAVNKNNPVWYWDKNGDIAHFYDSKGQLIGTVPDGNKFITPTVIDDEQVYLAKMMLELKKIKASDIQPLGLTYDVKAIGKFYDKSANYKAKKIGGDELKEPHKLRSEIGTAMIEKNRIVSPSQGEPNCEYNAAMCDPELYKNTTGDKYEDKRGFIHIHPEPFQNGGVYYGLKPNDPSNVGGDRDYYSSKRKYGDPPYKNSRDVVVSKDYIILYNDKKEQDIKIKR
jgi:hypothetical protein